jgi:hypothetical protein
MHFCEGKAELFPLGENVFMPGQSAVEVEAEIFDFIGLRKLNIIDFNRWAGCTPRSEGDMNWFISYRSVVSNITECFRGFILFDSFFVLKIVLIQAHFKNHILIFFLFLLV